MPLAPPSLVAASFAARAAITSKSTPCAAPAATARLNPDTTIALVVSRRSMTMLSWFASLTWSESVLIVAAAFVAVVLVMELFE